MNNKNILDNPFFIFILFVSVSLINIISSVHFITIMFVGVLFIAFIKTLQNRYYYSLFWIILALLVCENIQGFRAFNLVSLAFFIYIFIKPNIEHLFSSHDLLKIVYILIFYILMVILFGFDKLIVSTIIVNIILDIFIVGLFI